MGNGISIGEPGKFKEYVKWILLETLKNAAFSEWSVTSKVTNRK